MKYNSLSFTSVSLVVLSHLHGITEATCTKYTSSGDISKELGWFAPSVPGTARQVFKAMTCLEGKPDNYYDCMPFEQNRPRACKMPPRGSLVSKGTTNVTMSDDEVEHLFSLVNDAMPRRLAGYHNIYFNMEGCALRNTVTEPFGCLREGQSGYREGAPQLFCTEGTVSGCSDQGSLTEGMAVKVCGSKHVPQAFGRGFGRNHVPTFVYTIKHLNASEVDDYQEYPGNSPKGKRICDYVKTGGAAKLPSSWAALLGAAVVTFMGYEFIF